MRHRFASLLVPLLLTLLAACASEPVPHEPPAQPQAPRLASLAPALTAMLFSMGLGDQVVGVTRYCMLPDGQQRPVLGDALTVSTEAVLAAEPDVLLIQSDADKYAPLQQLDPSLQIEHFSIETLSDISDALRRLATIAGQPDLGVRQAGDLDAGFEAIRQQTAGLERPRVLFVMGSEKPGTAGSGTFLHELMELSGGTNAAAEHQGWATLNVEYVLAAQPDVLVCWSSPRDADRDRARWQALEDLPAARDGRVWVVTDSSWTLPTPKLLDHAQQLARMLHPRADDG